MKPMNKCILGAKIFIRDHKKVWACAEIIKEDGVDIVVKTEDDELIKLKPTDDFYLRNIDMWDSSGLSAPSDLTQLTHLHEASVLHSLNVRFDVDEIYTFTGPILIAVNPFKSIENLYSDSILAKHIQPIQSKSPHIFATANSAYVGLCTHNKSQTILISGESGAGKTESTKYVMKFLACAGSDIKKRSLIERQVLESNPLLEAFGNARTLRNDNSSRFGKYIELQFSIDKNNYVHGKLCGAKILTYLLEKVRVCDQQEGERSYHIFYQLCKAVEVAKRQAKKKLKRNSSNILQTDERAQLGQPKNEIEKESGNSEMKEKEDDNDDNDNDDNDNDDNDNDYNDNEEEEEEKQKCFYDFPMTKKFKEIENVKTCRIDFTKFKSHMHFRYLTKSSVFELNDIDEQEEFEATLFAMQTIGITEEEQYQIYKVLEGILYIGNILFNNDEYKEEAKILDVSKNDLKRAALLLDVDEKQLENALCYKTIIANKEHYEKPVNSDVANDIRDALARAIYGCLFLKVVERTNESIGYVDNINLFCGVLDIFGFESFPLNSFEQICINYTNECLQQFFNNFIFKCEEKLYIEENINWDPLDFPDNKDCVEILESKPFGIFSMLDEECQIPSGKDKTFCSKIIQKHKDNKRFNIIKTDPTSFIIVHFAGQVKYSALGFLEKNKDQLSTDAQTVLLNSTNKYISDLFEKYLRRSTDKRKFLTVSSEFREQLNMLMQRIQQTEPHFIRCIKPNSRNQPDIFDRISVNEQLKYGGVLQAVKVSRAGYPVRLSHEDCVLDYVILLNKDERNEFELKCVNKSWANKASFVLDKMYKTPVVQQHVEELKKIKENALQYKHYDKYAKRSKGVTKKEEQEENEIQNKMVEEAKNSVNSPNSVGMNNETSFIWSVGKTMCFFKSDAYNILSTMRSEFRSAQATVIQKNYKCYSQVKLYNLMKQKVVVLQKWFRYLLKLKRNEQLRIAKATQIICMAIYGYHIRKQFLHTKKCIIRIQARIKGILARKRYKEYRIYYYASKIQATWKTYKECNYFKSLKKATTQVQLRWKRVLAIRQLRRLKMEAKEVGSLLTKNQTLTKELQQERSKTFDIESKWLKALATIDKLTHAVANLEKAKKEQEAVIGKLKERLERDYGPYETASPQIKRKSSSLSEEVEINGVKSRSQRSSKEYIANHLISGIVSPKSKTDIIKKDDVEREKEKEGEKEKEEKKKKSEKVIKEQEEEEEEEEEAEEEEEEDEKQKQKQKEEVKKKTTINEHVHEMAKEHKKKTEEEEEEVQILLNRIRKLERENFELTKRNISINDKYTKLLNIMSQLKSKNVDIINKWDGNATLNKSGSDKATSYLGGGVITDTKIDPTGTEYRNIYRRSENHIDILICGPNKVGKTSLVEDLFVRLGDETNLNLLRKNKKREQQDPNLFTCNTYIFIYKRVKIKIVDCGYLPNRNMEETLFNQIKNALCIIVVFDATNKESIIPAVHLLQEASLLNVKKNIKLYLLENIFNEKIYMNRNTNDVSYALRIAKTCNAYYVKTLDIYDIVNEYASKLTVHSNQYIDNNNINNKDRRWKDNTVTNYNKRKMSPLNDSYNYALKVNELIAKFEKYADTKIGDYKGGNRSFNNYNSFSLNNENAVKGAKKDGGISSPAYAPNKNNTVNSLVNTIKAICGIHSKSSHRTQLLKESLPSNNYIYNSTNTKYNSALGKGFQAVCEINKNEKASVTYLVIGQDTLHKDHTLLAVGNKRGIVFIYKIFKTKMEMESDNNMSMGATTELNSTINGIGNENEKDKDKGRRGDDKRSGQGTGENGYTKTSDKKKETSSKIVRNADGKAGSATVTIVGTRTGTETETELATEIKGAGAEVKVSEGKHNGDKSRNDKAEGYKSEGNLNGKNMTGFCYDGTNNTDREESVQLLSRLNGHSKPITCIVFSPTEEKIVTSSIDKSIRVWEVSTGFPQKVFSDSSETLSVLMFPSNPNIFLCSNCNSLLRIVDLECGKAYQKLRMGDEIRALEIDDTGLSIFAGSKNGIVYVLEFIYNECVEMKFFSLFSTASITCITFVPRQSLKTSPCIFINSCDNEIGIMDCLYGGRGVVQNLSVRYRVRINHTCLPIQNTYSRFGGGWLISGSEDRNIYIFSLSNSSSKPILLKHHKSPVMAVAVNNKDTFMVSGDTDGNLVFWRRFCV